MKKIFILIIVCFTLSLPVLAANRSHHPLPAFNIEIVKKVSLELEDIKGPDAKGKPSSPNNKTRDDAATGILGYYPVTGDKYAIVIGICDYPGTSLDLCQSDGDSLHMYRTLTEVYGYEPGNIMLFKDKGGTTGPDLGEVGYGVPTYDNISKAVDSIRNNPNLTADDEVVFFFSGHGTRGTALDGDDEFTDEGIVVWADENDTEDNIAYIWDGELRDWFNGFATSRIVFVFDSCLAGGMNDVAANGRVVAMATEETKSAYVYSTAGEDADGDGIPDGEGVFSRYFVNKGMLQNLADVHDYVEIVGNESATVEEAFDYAKQNIPPYLKSRQKPVISDDFIYDLLF
ncbi:MAG: hypothetical protein A2V72_02280 [Candidatus Nealsonbacteria bacterium RBG_13_37_56]|uniref:Peptidase C14 caspase domain-containing protein n=1 Tax=Candidatus Nealsonbacteria bacterium RBG_13_37_56 TaxID=1801661 RepID=A0A1G2DVJ5_9BACT|nr:MAG: hypothetical protein A2V72_02280 [Candidatus Nealsonbacteria bacterium RBG_13_37_56]